MISSYVLSGLIGLIVIYLSIDSKLPDQTDEVIIEITSKNIPELVDGKTGYVTSGSVKIWYEIKNKSLTPKGSVLLINGYTEPSTLWHQNIIKSN